MRKPARLFNYRNPAQAARTLKALRAAWPACQFELRVSPLAVYAFRYLIHAIQPDGRAAFVARAPLASFNINREG